MRPKKPKAREGETFEHFAASRAKWDFSEASLKEHGILDNEMRMECWAYEFSRENEQLVEAIRVWRASFGGSLSFAQLNRASAGSPMLRIPRNKQQGIAGRFVTIRFHSVLCFLSRVARQIVLGNWARRTTTSYSARQGLLVVHLAT
jgi:hypothetical protein